VLNKKLQVVIAGEKLERNIAITNKNSRKLFVSSMLVILMLSSLSSFASAADDDSRTQVPPEENPNGPSGDPTLYDSQDNVTSTSDDNPVLIQQNDNITVPSNDASSTNNAQESGDLTVLSAQTQPDNTAFVIVIIALVATIAVSATVIVSQRRKK
jgi:hypothetical protein